MYPQSYKLVLDNPCEADWASMTQTSTGRHCNQCSKNVIDFSSYSKEAIIDYFVAHAGESICGRMHKKQIENIVIQIDGNLLYTNISFWKKFLIIFLIIFGQQLYGAEFAFAQVIQTDTLKLDTALITKVDTSKVSSTISDSIKVENDVDTNTALDHVFNVTDSTVFVDSVLSKNEEKQIAESIKILYRLPLDFEDFKLEPFVFDETMVFGGFGLMPIKHPLEDLLEPPTAIFPKEIIQTSLTEKSIKHIHYATNAPIRKKEDDTSNDSTLKFILPSETEEERRKKKSV